MDNGSKDMIFGALWFFGGIIVTVATFSAASNGGTICRCVGSHHFWCYSILPGSFQGRQRLVPGKFNNPVELPVSGSTFLVLS